MKIYTFEMLYKDMPQQLGDVRYNNMFCEGDDDTEIQPFIYINNICIFCDNSDLVYIPVSEFGPVIVVNFLLDGNLAANFILHIDDEIIVDNEIITFIQHTSDETMQELAGDTDLLPDEENPEAYNKWVKEQQPHVMDIIKAHKEKKAMEDDEDIFGSIETFENFMKENIKAAVDDIIKPRNHKPPTT